MESKNIKLDLLLFEKETNNLNKNIEGQSSYSCLDFQNQKNNNIIDYYILPNNENNTAFISNVLYSEKITDLSIKNKLLKINSSMKSFNILLKPNNSLKFDYNQLNPIMIDNLLSNDNYKNYFINFLLEFIIDFIWKIKEENLQRDSLNEKIIILNNNKEDMQKKIKKISNELEDKKREIKSIFNKTENQREKLDKNLKGQNGEINDIKNENKKLTNMVNLYKNEIKKKELDFFKLQEKYKKNMGVNKIQNFGLDYALNVNQNSNINFFNNEDPKLNILTKTILESTEEKLILIVNQNSYLFNLLRHLKNYIEKFTIKYFDYIQSKNGKSKNYSIDLMQIKDNMFSVHLLEKNLLDQFHENYINHLNKFDEIIKYLLEMNNSDFSNFPFTKKELQFNKNSPQKSKDDIIKKFKKWSINSIIRDTLHTGYKGHKNNQTENISSKWFNNIDKCKEIHYEYNENNVIKADTFKKMHEDN